MAIKVNWIISWGNDKLIETALSEIDQGSWWQNRVQFTKQTHPKRTLWHSRDSHLLPEYQHGSAFCQWDTKSSKKNNRKISGIGLHICREIKASISSCISLWSLLSTWIWTMAKVPSDLKHSTLISISKKGDATKPGNCWGISLLSMPGKIFSHIILQRIQTT